MRNRHEEEPVKDQRELRCTKCRLFSETNDGTDLTTDSQDQRDQETGTQEGERKRERQSDRWGGGLKERRKIDNSK